VDEVCGSEVGAGVLGGEPDAGAAVDPDGRGVGVGVTGLERGEDLEGGPEPSQRRNWAAEVVERADGG
jgi:hypothetical protein